MIETVASILSITGALLMSRNNNYSKYAYALWPVASTLWCVTAYNNHLWGMFITTFMFVCLETMGAYKWILRRDK